MVNDQMQAGVWCAIYQTNKQDKSWLNRVKSCPLPRLNNGDCERTAATQTRAIKQAVMCV